MTACTKPERPLFRIAIAGITLALGGACALSLAGCAAGGDDDGAEGGVAPYVSSRHHDASAFSEAADSSAAAPSASAREKALAVQQAVQDIVAPYGEGVSVTFMPVGEPEGLVSVNGGVQHSSASMIKLLVLSALLDAAQQGTVDLSSDVEVTADDIVAGTGTVQEDGPGTYALQELARRMIADSDNTATNVIVDLIGMDAVNAEAGKLGLTGTVMARKMMDTSAAEQGMQNRMSSDDAATILNMIATGTLVSPEMSNLALGFLLQQNVNAGLTDGVPAGVDVAHKTGELVQVEHDGGIVLAAQPYVLVVMTEGVDNGVGTSLIAQVSAAVYAASNGEEVVPGQTEVAAAAIAAAGTAEGPSETYAPAGGYDEPDVSFVGYDGTSYSGGGYDDADYADDGGDYDGGDYGDGDADGGYVDDGSDAGTDAGGGADTPATDGTGTGNATGGGTASGENATDDAGTGGNADTGSGTTSGTGTDAGGAAAGGDGAGTGAAAAAGTPDNDTAAA